MRIVLQSLLPDRRPLGAVIATVVSVAVVGAAAASDLSSWVISTDSSVTLSTGGAVADHELLNQDLQVRQLGPLPPGVDIDAYHLRANGSQLFSLDAAAELGGTSFGPADVILFTGGIYSHWLDAVALGLPEGADIDAVSDFDGGLLVSFDAALPSSDIGPEDLAFVAGNNLALSVDFSAAGVPKGLDLDAVHLCPDGRLFLSFDAAGTIDGIVFADEDVLEFDLASAVWSLGLDVSVAEPVLATTDVDALSAGTPPGLLFRDDFETGDLSRWSSQIP